MRYIDDEDGRYKASAASGIFCFNDAQKRSDMYEITFDREQVALAEHMQQIAEKAYFAKSVFLNFRKGFVVVKVCRIKDVANSGLVEELQKLAEVNGFERNYINHDNSVQFKAKRIPITV